jgi:Short C-terminal domain
MLRRRRPLLRAAAVGGGAYIAGKHMANKANEQAAYQDQQDQRISDLEAQQQQAPPDQQYQQAPPQYQQAPPQYQQPPPQYQQAPPPPAPAAPSVYDQLSQLATLHDQGALTDDEFTAAKAKLLGT